MVLVLQTKLMLIVSPKAVPMALQTKDALKVMQLYSDPVTQEVQLSDEEDKQEVVVVEEEEEEGEKEDEEEEEEEGRQ
jgi:hypothetical protein